MLYEYAFDSNQEFKGICEKYIILGKERDDGKNINVNVIKEDSHFDEGLYSVQNKIRIFVSDNIEIFCHYTIKFILIFSNII